MAAALINVAGFDEDSITNGPGLRFVLFTQGCPHKCVGCHNPQTHEFGTGQDYTVDQLYELIRRNPLQTGVTFSGGEPFCQAAPLAELAEKLKQDHYDIAIYSGYTFEYLLYENDPDKLRLLSFADILVDGPFILARKDILLHFRGSDNQRILDVPASLSAQAPRLADSEDWC